MAYGYRATLTVAHGQVGGSDLSNFPVYFAGDAGCATVANGGHLINTDSGLPADLIVTSDSAGMTVVPFEIVAGTYDATTGAMELHFLVATVSHTVDTVYYLWIGNAAVTTYQGDDAAVWAGYSYVLHLPDGSSLSGSDSTSNGNDGSPVNSPVATAGQLDGCGQFDGTNYLQITGTGTGLTVGTNPFTSSAWFKMAADRGSEHGFVCRSDFATSDLLLQFNDNGTVRGDLYFHGANMISSTGTYDDDAWHLMHFVRDTGSTLLRLYVDGVSAASPVSDVSTNISITNDFTIGTQSGIAFVGEVDECRFLLIDRSADWIAAEYNNQKSGQTFLSLGPFVPQGGGSPDLMLYTVLG